MEIKNGQILPYGLGTQMEIFEGTDQSPWSDDRGKMVVSDTDKRTAVGRSKVLNHKSSKRKRDVPLLSLTVDGELG